MDTTSPTTEHAPVRRTRVPVLENSYASLPERFFAPAEPVPVPAPRLVKLNEGLARELGIDPGALGNAQWAELFSGNALPETARPIALAYAGHQFGQFVPRLGDGRAILLGEAVDRDGRLRDIQLKGAGRTAFSRGGDGRAAIGPVLREYLVSEAMAALGIPTTRALAAVTTGDAVYRERRLPGAVLTRVAASHIRIGTFQYFAARGDTDGVRILADHAIARHYPDAAGADEPYLAFYDHVVAAQARLVAQWMLVGFIHGVMNTDNTSISGETIDYGPCAFMDAYHPGTVFSSIDQFGRYAFANQKLIAQWNLARLAEALLPLLGPDQDAAVERAQERLATFPGRFEAHHLAGMRRKLGLAGEEPGDAALAGDLLDAMARSQADFTLTFRALGAEADGEGTAARHFSEPAGFDAWAARWRQRLAREPEPGPTPGGGRRAAMDAVNPKYIPRNHRVEAVIAAAVDRDDFGPFEELLGVLQRPFDEQPGFERLAEPPAPEERVLQTFCGT